jgi:hypothetical protein
MESLWGVRSETAEAETGRAAECRDGWEGSRLVGNKFDRALTVCKGFSASPKRWMPSHAIFAALFASRRFNR